MTISAAEQLLFELINRARLDPLAEAARLGIGLNDGLRAGTINGSAKQALAPNDLLEIAAQGHSEWMLEADTFSHTGRGGSTAFQRMEAAGYDFLSPWASGENIAFFGSTRVADEVKTIAALHENLFRSAGHRENILNADFRELGVAMVAGAYTDKSSGITYNGSYMLTENFAASGTPLFITGVVHDDRDGNDFYTPGEGVSGTLFLAAGRRAASAEAGGYALRLPDGTGQRGLVDVEIVTTQGKMTLALDMAGQNAKLDVVDGTALRLSSSAVLGDGISAASLLGVADLSLTGGAASERLTGNSGANLLAGGEGDDSILGADGNDTIYAGLGDDFIGGGAGNDLIYGGDGANTIYAGAGNDTVQGGAGNDTIYGSAWRNALLGNDGNDVIYTSAAGDFAAGGAGNDMVLGGAGDDTIYAGLGDDFIGGGEGNDLIFAGAGTNRIYGGFGDDTLHAGAGRDVMTGSPGADTFVFAFAAHAGIGAGRDVITDFTPGEDHIDLTGLGTVFNGQAGLTGGGQASFYFYAPLGLVIGDQNGDGGADWVLELSGVQAVSAGDFLL